MSAVKPLTLVIADDEAMVNHALQSQAARLGFQILGVAYHAEETIEKVRTLRPDVLILDMKMPHPLTGLDDPEAGLKAARAIQEGCPTAIVLLTAYESVELVEKARAAGIGAYLLKPAKDNDLARAIAIATARFRDLQELRRANQTLARTMEELQKRESLFRALSECSPMVIFRAGPEGSLSYLSPQWEEFAGTPVEEGLAGGLAGLAHPEEAEGVLASFREAMETRINWLHVHRFLGPDGAIKWVRALAAPMLDDHGHYLGAVGMLDDITRQKRAGELRQRAEKQESLGIMAGGIAHDFNNLLSAIQGNLELLRLHLPEGGAPSRFLDHAEQSVTRAAHLSRLMLAFAGRAHLASEPLDLNLAVQGLKQTLAQGPWKIHALQCHLEDSIPLIEGDLGEIQQALQALVLNAYEACEPTQGTVTLRLERVTLDAETLATMVAGQDLEPGEYVALRVEDTGPGMDATTLARIFDPFFTTKFMGRGLGLSATLGTVQAHQGGLQVLSEPGKGSAFILYFPPSRRFQREGHPLSVAEAGPSEARTVLLAEDEAAVRTAVGDMLIFLGYHVLFALDGREALETFAAQPPGTIDAVITDLTMPRLDGYEAALAMLKLDPDVKLILSSGYTQAEATQRFGDTHLSGFLQKPYRLKELREVLQQALGN